MLARRTLSSRPLRLPACSSAQHLQQLLCVSSVRCVSLVVWARASGPHLAYLVYVLSVPLALKLFYGSGDKLCVHVVGHGQFALRCNASVKAPSVCT